MQTGARSLPGRFLIFILIVAAFIFFLFPIYWMIATSFKTQEAAFNPTPQYIFKPTLQNYKKVFTSVSFTSGGKEGAASTKSPFPRQLGNSALIAGASTILAVGLGTLTAYAFSRFRLKGKNDLSFFILSTRMLPPVAVVIPIFLMFKDLKLYDTHLGLILAYTAFNLPFAVWMMKGFLDEIPKEYEDAAMVDGYTRWQAIRKVIMPQATSALAATGVFCLITAWNEFAFAVTLTGNTARTAVPGIASAIGGAGLDWGVITASATVFVLPVFLFTFLVRNHLLRGVTFGAVRR